MQSVGFKEWAVVCEALGRGEQSVILRKGGIAEGRHGFDFRHQEFFLFPTFFHEQFEKTGATSPIISERRDTEIEIRFLARVERAAVITSWETAEALAPFHILQPAVVGERFNYSDAMGIHVAFVRIFRLESPWIFPDAKSYGGCRSWVQLPERPGKMRLVPVAGDREHTQRMEQFDALVVAPAESISR